MKLLLIVCIAIIGNISCSFMQSTAQVTKNKTIIKIFKIKIKSKSNSIKNLNFFPQFT